jgi:hypothetical protein
MAMKQFWKLWKVNTLTIFKDFYSGKHLDLEIISAD